MKRLVNIAVLCAACALAAFGAAAKTRAMFFFDAEDYTNPRSWDALRDLSTLFHEEGVTVHVALVGYLAHQLEANGRRDVLDALKPHLVGTQSAYHSRHPNVMELSDGEDYAAAYARVFAEESEGIRMIERATGKKVGFAVPPGTSKSYVAMYAYADMGLKFYCDTVIGGEQGGSWHGLGLRQCPYTVSMEFLLPDPDRELRESDIAAQLDRAAKEEVAIFYLHPCMAVCRQFWDGLNYNRTNAVELGKWKLSEPRPDADTKLYLSRLRQLVRRLRADGRFEFATVDGLAAEEKPRVPVRRADAARICSHLADRGIRPMDAPSWSVADLFQAAIGFLNGGSTHVPGRTCGFLAKPYAVSSPVTLKASDLRAAAKTIDLKSFLPTSVSVGGVKVGPGDFLRAAWTVLAKDVDAVTVPPADPLAEVRNHPELKDFRAAGTWVFTPDYRDEYTTDRLRWQIWTVRREPAASGSGAAEAGHAKWLAYPGDYALWAGNELMPRRIERGHGYPPFWPGYMHHPSVRFETKVDLARPVKVKVSAKGTFMISGKGGQLSMSGDGDECTLAAGQYKLDVLVFSQKEPPAVKIEGDGFATDESWTASWYAAEPRTPADVFDDDPARSPLKLEPMAFAKVEKDGRGVFGDLGREDFGFVTLVGVSGSGRARIVWAESEGEARETDERRLECWETVVLKPGDNRLKVSRGFRYVRVVPDGDLSVEGLRFEREYYPVTAAGWFHSDDERLNRIWEISRRTLALTLREIPVEGAKRDRWTWSGDAIQSYLMNYYLFGDAKPVRDAIWYLRGGDPVVLHLNGIMDYTYYWFVSVSDYYRFTGDERFLRQVYPRMVTLMDFVIGRLDGDGRPHDRPGDWMFIDWAPKPLANYGGVTSFETMLLARAMDAVAEVGEVVGAAKDEVAGYRARAKKLRDWVKPTFWNEERGGLMHLKKDDGTLDPQFTRYPNIFGLFYGYFNSAESRRVVKDVLLNDGVMKLQTPYMRFYELEALAKYGLRELVLGEIRSYWGAMLDEGATTFWELYNSDEKGAAKYAMYGRPYGKSLCHAWGASPAYLLGRYFLGVEPTKPGFAEYTVAPDPAGLRMMEGAVPTPTGVIRVRVENGTAVVTGNGGRGVLRWNGKSVPVAPRATVRLN